MRKEERRKMYLKLSPKNQDTGKPSASSRNVLTSSQPKHDMWPTRTQRCYIAINVTEMEYRKPRPAWGDLSHPLDRQEA